MSLRFGERGVFRAGGVLEWVFLDVGPSGSAGTVLGLVHSTLGWGPCFSWAAGPRVSGKGDLGSTGGFQGKQWRREVFLGAIPRPGQVGQLPFQASRESPVCPLAMSVLTLVHVPRPVRADLPLCLQV